MTMQSVFSPLAHGCGSWDGDLQQQELKHVKEVLDKSVSGESHDYLEKRVHIPLRIKSQLSQIQSILQEASRNFPVNSTLANAIKYNTESTEYSRPLGSVRNTARPRTGGIRASKQQHRPSLGGVARTDRLHRRAKSAPTSRPAHPGNLQKTDVTLPKTLTTRKGALMIFTMPKHVAFSVPEQKCYHVDPNATNMDSWASNLKSFKKLTSSVLQYGTKSANDLESVASASEYNTTCFKYLHKEEYERGSDYRLQPGGDFVFYLQDIKTKSAVRNVVSSMSYASHHDLKDEIITELGTLQSDNELKEMQNDQEQAMNQPETQFDSVAPKMEYLGPLCGSPAWTTQTEGESVSNADSRSHSQSMETTGRFPAESAFFQSNPPQVNLASRPGTARSNRSVSSWQSGTPLSSKDITASLKSSGYLGRPISAPYPPYSPSQSQLPLPPETEMEEFASDDETEVEGQVSSSDRAGSARSQSGKSSGMSFCPKSSRASPHTHVDDNSEDDATVSKGGNALGRSFYLNSTASRRSSGGVQSPLTHGVELEGSDKLREEWEYEDWQSQDLADLGIQNIEEVDGKGDGDKDELARCAVQAQSQSRVSSNPPRVYTPRTRSSRRSTPPPDGDQWPGLDDGVQDQSRTESRTRTTSAKSRWSSQSRPRTPGSNRTQEGADQEQGIHNGVREAADKKEEISHNKVIEAGDSIELVGESMGAVQEQDIVVISPSVPSHRVSIHSGASTHPQGSRPAEHVRPPPLSPAHLPHPSPPATTLSHALTPPSPMLKSFREKKADAAIKVEENAKKLDLSSLTPADPKKQTAITKAEKRSPNPKARKGCRGKKGGGSSPRRKFGGVDFLANPGGSSYDEPSQDDIAKMIQEELSQQLAEANINLEAEAENENEVKEDPNDTDRASVATDDEAIEREIKQKSKAEKGVKKSKKQISKEKAALKDARRQERQRRQEEKRALAEKKKQVEEERRRQEYEEKRRKEEIEEQLRDAEEEALRAAEEEEIARQMLQETRRAAREEREKRRKEEMERKKEERERQREQQRKMEEAARMREREMAERLADAAERRRIREEAEWEAEEREREERERREQEEDEEFRRMEEEEERIRELERQAEQEALERLMNDRREAEERRQRAREDAQRQKEDQERKMKAELQHLAEEEEKERQRAMEAERKRQEELEKIRKIQQLEEEARTRVQKKLESRRLWALRRRELNNEQRGHLNGLRYTQGTTRPWVFSYYVLWPRETFERQLPSKEKKRGFRPRRKPVAPPVLAEQAYQNTGVTQEVNKGQIKGLVSQSST